MLRDVFVSYSSQDRQVADAICASIEKSGVEVWIAPRDILPPRSYGEAIIDAINSSKLMIVVFSSNSDGSNQVFREVERAVAKRVPVIPFRIENVLPTRSMEYFLSSQHWMDAHTPPLESHIENLTKIVRQLADNQFTFEPSAATAAATTTYGQVSGLDGTAPAGFRARANRVAHELSRRSVIAAAAAVALPSVAGGIWWFRRASVPEDASAIAVLPFRNLAQDATIDYLSLAMPSELNSQLSRTASVILRPLESVRTYKDKDWTAPEVAKVLHVATVVGGSFWRSDQQLRMSVDIIKSHENRNVWSEPFQVEISDLLGLVERIVRKVAAALRFRMEMKPAGTDSAEVYESYLRALTLGQEITDENNLSAIRLLKQAVTADPGFARAHAALAEAYVTRFWWNFSNDTSWLALAEASAGEALKLDSTLPEAHVARGYALEGQGKRADAAREYFAGLRAGPHHVGALASVARYSFYMKDFDRALATLATIATVDPTANVHIRRAMCFYFAGRLDESRSENQLAERRAQGVDQLTLVSFTYVWLKELDAAERVLRRLEKEQPTALSIAEVRAWLFTAWGQIPEARQQMEIIAKRPTFGIADEIATLYAVQGDAAQAIEWLEKAVKLGAPNYAWYSSDFFKILRGDARYEAILKELTEEYKTVHP